jgi:serine/threonine protein kinase
MTPQDEPDPADPLRQVIQTRHPGIADEIQDAIETLRKLQQIAGSALPEPRAAAPDTDQSAVVTSDGAARPASGAAKAHGGTFVLNTPLTPAGEAVLDPGESFGRYQIVRQLGRGAMGAVYLAYDTQLHRHVALKTPFLGNNPQVIGRFLREARTAAQLRSPYICPVYDAGEIGGVHYLSMAYIEGRPLERVLAEGQLSRPEEVAEITKKLARGLQKAHDAGIIHRDLKPENIMIDADGEPIVMDFGLARRVDEDVHLTMAGRLLGTPAYMSPEQVEGDPKKIGPPTDIYSLGVVLYRMLAGRLPFRGSLTSVLRQIGSAAPAPPSSVAPGISPGAPLERVCLKMMAKSTSERYASMAEVVTALETLSAGPARRPVWQWLWSLIAKVLTRPRRAQSAPATPPAADAKPPRTQADSRTLGRPEELNGSAPTTDIPALNDTPAASAVEATAAPAERPAALRTEELSRAGVSQADAGSGTLGRPEESHDPSPTVDVTCDQDR